MKYLIDGKHVKTIPAKFKVLGDLSLFFSDYSRIRLQPDERNMLEKAYSWYETGQELKKSKQGKITLDLLKGEKPDIALEVLLRDGKKYHVLRTKEGNEVRVKEKIFNSFPNKQVIRRNY